MESVSRIRISESRACLCGGRTELIQPSYFPSWINKSTAVSDIVFAWLKCRKSLLEAYVIVRWDWTSDFEGTRTPIWLPYLEESLPDISQRELPGINVVDYAQEYTGFSLLPLCFPWFHGLGPIKDLGHLLYLLGCKSEPAGAAAAAARELGLLCMPSRDISLARETVDASCSRLVITNVIQRKRRVLFNCGFTITTMSFRDQKWWVPVLRLKA
jgi:hypothetical protein